jgi:CheY-like chemotaxis protein
MAYDSSLRKHDHGTANQPHPRAWARALTFLTSPQHPPVRVLVVEDENNMATVVQTMLASDERIEIVGRAHDGREALSMAASLDPDVILMDLEMPLMDGVEATRRLRESASTVCIIVHTNVEDVSRLRDAEDAGADAFVTKVPTAEKLAEVILTEHGVATTRRDRRSGGTR